MDAKTPRELAEKIWEHYESPLSLRGLGVEWLEQLLASALSANDEAWKARLEEAITERVKQERKDFHNSYLEGYDEGLKDNDLLRDLDEQYKIGKPPPTKKLRRLRKT